MHLKIESGSQKNKYGPHSNLNHTPKDEKLCEYMERIGNFLETECYIH